MGRRSLHTHNVAADGDRDPAALTYSQAAELLGVDANTIRIRAEKQQLYRKVPGSQRPAMIYAHEVYDERAELLRKLQAADLRGPGGATPASGPATGDRQHLIDEIASLRDQLARATEAARILLMSDSAKNDLLRQYLYDDVVPPQH